MCQLWYNWVLVWVVYIPVHCCQFHAAGALSREKSHPIHLEGAAGASPKSLGRKMRENVRGFASKMKSAADLDLRGISWKAGNGSYFPVCHPVSAEGGEVTTLFFSKLKYIILVMVMVMPMMIMAMMVMD